MSATSAARAAPPPRPVTGRGGGSQAAAARVPAPRSPAAFPGPVRAPARPPRPSLVPALPPRPSGLGFVALCALLMVAPLLALLALNLALSADAFTVDALERRAQVLREEEDALRLEVAVVAGPDSLAARARELGMVPVEVLAPVPAPVPEPAGTGRPAGPP